MLPLTPERGDSAVGVVSAIDREIARLRSDKPARSARAAAACKRAKGPGSAHSGIPGGWRFLAVEDHQALKKAVGLGREVAAIEVAAGGEQARLEIV